MDLSWSELLVVGIVALIIIGPKDLPAMFRELGRITAKLRSMGREFSRAMEQAAKEAGVNEISDDLKKIASPKSMGLDAVRSAADKFEKWDPIKNAAKPSKPLTPAPMPPVAQPAAASAVSGEAVSGSAAEAVAAAAPAAPGPATQALIDKQAARKAIIDEMNQKLKALDTAPSAPVAETAAPVEAAPAKAKPGRTRKSKADTE